MAQSLISELRVFIDENIQKKTPISIEFIDENMKEKIIKRAIQDEPISRDDLDDLIKQGKFVQYIDEDLLVDMFCVWPDLFLDGHFFINNYLGINEELQKKVVERISALLKDILWLLGSGRNTISHDNSWRLNYAKSVASMRLLMSWRLTEMSGFVCEELLTFGTWQAMERMVARLLEHSGFSNVMVCGGTGDNGADIVGNLITRDG